MKFIVNIEEITDYFNELFKLWVRKVLVEKQNLLNIFTIRGFGTACTGMYETTRIILGFFLPTPPDGIYSTKELIQQISLALNGETNALTEIVEEANGC